MNWNATTSPKVILSKDNQLFPVSDFPSSFVVLLLFCFFPTKPLKLGRTEPVES